MIRGVFCTNIARLCLANALLKDFKIIFQDQKTKFQLFAFNGERFTRFLNEFKAPRTCEIDQLTNID